MHTHILVEDRETRARSTIAVPSAATRLSGVHRVKWHGAETKKYTEFYSLTHVVTGRALNQTPLTEAECEQLIDEVLACGIELDRIVDGETAKRFYADQLSQRGERLAGRI